MTLTEFLLARIAEDEDAARSAHYEGQCWVPEEEAVVAADRDLDPILYLDRKRDAAHAANWSPARVLAECEAKRRIVDMYRGMEKWVDEGWATASPATTPFEMIAENYMAVIKVHAAVYADHPDYRDEWRP